MRYFEEQIGENGAVAKFYLHEANPEIDGDRLYPVMVLCPGGGYMFTSNRESEMVALQFFAKGFQVMVVHYATEGVQAFNAELVNWPDSPISQYPNPLVELATAMTILKENAEEWSINEEYIVVGGFSAGGNLAAQLGVHWHEEWLAQLVDKSNELYRPTHLVLIYPALTIPSTVRPEYGQSVNPMMYAITGKAENTEVELADLKPTNFVNDMTPPSFIWHTREDDVVPVTDSIEFALALEQYKIPYELHIFDKGKHGLSLANILTGRQTANSNYQASKWIDLLLEWLAPTKTAPNRFFDYTE